MKYKYAVIVETERNDSPDYKINKRLDDEFAGWEVVSATTTESQPFKGRDELTHIDIITTVVVRKRVA